MDVQPDVKTLYERVERLEWQNLWMKRTGVVAVLLCRGSARKRSSQGRYEKDRRGERVRFEGRERSGSRQIGDGSCVPVEGRSGVGSI
jgi:hypothetical protein